MRIPCPRAPLQGKAHIANGRKPTLSDETVLEIKRKADAGASNTALAVEYGVKPGTIRNAITRAEFSSQLRDAYQLDRI